MATMTVDEIVAELRAYGSSAGIEGMARFGIATTNTLGVNIPTLSPLLLVLFGVGLALSAIFLMRRSV